MNLILEKMSHICHILNVAVTIAPPDHIEARKGAYKICQETILPSKVMCCENIACHMTLFGWQGRG
jgi:hypothetical protein